ncbi:MAG: glucosylceramidase [Oscillospiraceae bacterium]|nr:glucosylceramidase [Oscillospiraceae bacterium]
MGKIRVYQSKMNDDEMLKQIETDVVFSDSDDCMNPFGEKTISVFPKRRYQEIIGFGGAFTETASYNYSLMSDASKKKIVEALFDTEKGIGYNFCRTHINSADFALSRYTYVEENDIELKTFDIGREKNYVIPFINDVKELTKDSLLLFASPWSPPGWMKDTGSMIEGGRLLDEYYEVWANYFVKYFEEFKKQGIDFFALSVQNEARAWQTWESCRYTAEEEGRFVHEYLRPALDKAGLNDIKIMIWDHNRERIYERASDTFELVPGSKDDVWGIAFHWYSGDHFASLDMTNECFPDKPLILSEYCLGTVRVNNGKGAHANWMGAEMYARELISCFNHHMAAEVDWNMVVDEEGGPYHDRSNGCKAVIVVDPKNDLVYLEPTYYAVGHFSKFVERGAVRIGCSSLSEDVIATAFQNPNGDLILVVLNQLCREEELEIRLNGSAARVIFPPHSLTTYVIEA